MARSRWYSTRPKIACTRKKAFWPGASTRWGRAAAKYSAVVPANAETHNHRRQLLRRASAGSQKNTDHAVWVPAFAGTTTKCSPPFDSQPPTPDNRHDVSIPRKQNHPDEPDPRALGRAGR